MTTRRGFLRGLATAALAAAARVYSVPTAPVIIDERSSIYPEGSRAGLLDCDCGGPPCTLICWDIVWVEAPGVALAFNPK